MSHELRTPLNAILGFGQLLVRDSDQPLAERQLAQVKQIVGAGNHLLTLITEVLDLARIEAGKLVLSSEPVALAPLIDDCLALMQPLAHERDVALALSAPIASTWHAWADRTRLRQVLLNLLSNAIKYNRPGGHAGVACSRDGDRVVVAVHDTGVGLDDAQQQQLFKPFERLLANADAIEGTGIGLALTHRLVGLMHGTIDVRSTPGEGSTFRVGLPWADAPAAASGAVAARPEAGSPAAGARLRTLLYVEDNPVNTMLMEALLEERRDLRLLTAALPAVGLDLARAHPPDLILLDIHLPDIDGCELLQRLRQQAATAKTPAIAISASAMPEDIERSRAAGFAAYVTKPFDMVQLMQTIDTLLGP
jgi:CheY-like chemotaxis protein